MSDCGGETTGRICTRFNLNVLTKDMRVPLVLVDIGAQDSGQEG